MNEDILQGQWKQVKGRIRTWFGKLTDDDLAKINGRLETLLGTLQERYGYTREQAEAEVDRHLRELEAMTMAE